MKKTINTTNATNANDQTVKSTFADLVSKYGQDTTNATTLYDLATAVTYAVLKKVINTTANPTLTTVRKELTRDRADLDRLTYANDNATRLTFTADGDMETEVVDPSLVTAAAKLAGLPLGDGLDLVHAAVVKILEQTAAQRDRDPDMPTDLERPYTVRRLKRKVWIKTEDSVNGWETVQTTPIQEVYKAVRRSIDQSRAAQTDPRNGYTYLEDLAVDSDSGETATIYRRLPKYADLGGRVCDFNGKETVSTTADRATVEDLDRLVAALELSDRQATVLTLRLRGYGYKAIATRLGLDVANVNRTRKQIAAKMEKLGMTAAALA